VNQNYVFCIFYHLYDRMALTCLYHGRICEVLVLI